MPGEMPGMNGIGFFGSLVYSSNSVWPFAAGGSNESFPPAFK
jgi:hypothetical protein